MAASIQAPALDEDALHDRADAFVSGLDRTERVTWLKSRGISDQQILEALLDPQNRDLDEFARDIAHGIASDAANGSIAEEAIPDWLR